MARLKNGILGGISGKAGPVTGSSWKRVDVIKTNSRKKIEKKDLLPQSFAFKVMSEFLRCFKEEINLGFYDRKNKATPGNRAMKINLNRAITGKSPDFEIDFKEIVLSKGSMETAWVAMATRETESLIRITWEIPETLNLKLIGSDEVRILFYNVTTKKALRVGYSATRSDLSAEINIKDFYKNDHFHIWMFFVSADGKNVSDSDYVGFV